jgi:hypothetical protein
MLDKQGSMHERAYTRPRAPVPTRTHTQTIGFLPVKNMVDHYRFDAPESKYGNEIAPSRATFERGTLELKETSF